jgi:phage protein D
VEAIRKPAFKIVYNNKDITADVSANVLSIAYTDNDEKEADEIDLSFEDVDGLWRNSWYPVKGSTIKLSIGYNDGALVDCGTFDIDEVTIQGPPDTINIRGIATGFKKAMRTKKSRGFENQTLRQIAQAIARDNGLTIVGTIADIKFVRVTQNREKDLSFLARIADEYGYLFSVRESKLIFTSRVDIENGQPVLSIDRGELRSYSIKDKTSETYKGATAKYHNPGDGKVKEAKVNTLSNADNVTYKQIATDDTLEVRTKAETPAQADAKASAALHKKNSEQRTGTLAVEGAPSLVAGNCFTLTGLGETSGKYYIKKSSHRIDKGSGYTTQVEIKQINAAAAAQKSKQTQAPKASKYQVQTLSNRDAVTFNQIIPQ